MAKGSVRKKGKKWYYRYYVEDASGNRIQKECVGTESKAETEKMLRDAIRDYEEKQFIAKTHSLTLGEMLDIWAEEDLKVGTLSNGTVDTYLHAVRKIKEHPIGKRKLKTEKHERGGSNIPPFLLTKGRKYDGLHKQLTCGIYETLTESFRPEDTRD